MHRECREGNKTIRHASKCCTQLPVIHVIHLPLCMSHHLISHVRLSVSILRGDSDRGGTAVGFRRPRNSCKVHMELHLFKSCSIMGCISTKASCSTVHSGVLSGLSLLTSEQMEIIWEDVRPENGLASIFLSQACSLKWGNAKRPHERNQDLSVN